MTFPFPIFCPSVPSATIAYTDNGAIVATQSTFTFLAKNIGTPAADRIVLVGEYYNRSSAGARSISSLSVGGTALSLVKDWGGTSSNTMEVWGGIVSSGATGDVVVVGAGGDAVSCGITIAVIHGANSTVYATASDSVGDPLSAGINVTAGGVVFAYAANAYGGADAFTWTNLTERFDGAFHTNVAYHSIATDAFGAAQTPLTVTANPDLAMSEGGLILISYQAV